MYAILLTLNVPLALEAHGLCWWPHISIATSKSSEINSLLTSHTCVPSLLLLSDFKSIPVHWCT